MNEQPVVMVQVADPEWTWTALHAACALAQKANGSIALVQTVSVKHPAYLGTAMGYLELKEHDLRNLRAYAGTVAGYGLHCDVMVFQAYSQMGCIVEAAERVGAWYVYAKPHGSRIPLWNACQLELLRMRLSRQNCELLAAPDAQPINQSLDHAREARPAQQSLDREGEVWRTPVAYASGSVTSMGQPKMHNTL